MSGAWIKVQTGVYEKVDGVCRASVVQEGELWKTLVSYGGNLVDTGTWDGRGAAFRCADGAIERAKTFFDPLAKLNKVEIDADEDEGDDE